VPRRTSAAPKHRASGLRTAPPASPAAAPAPAVPARHRASRRAVPWRLGVAVAVTGAAVATTGAATTGVLPLAAEAGDGGAARTGALDLSPATTSAVSSATAAALRERGETQVSRSDRRTPVDPRKAALLGNESRSGGQVSRTEEIGGGDPRSIAQALLPQFGFGADQFPCLDALWTKESGWDVHADNPTSSAYGIPQSLPGEKMATVGADWADNPATQIRWGLGYIKASYGNPCGAWAHSQSYNWY
jgi:hypothetical protein